MPPRRFVPRLIPVLDVMGGVVVRAVGGRRDEYRPIESRLTTATTPIEVGRALCELVGATEVYVADLDAIRGAGAISLPVAEFTAEGGFHPCWIDAGVTTYEQFLSLPFLGGVRQVVASETCPGPHLLTEIAGNGRADTIAFSLDLRDGRLLGDWRCWGLEHERDVMGLVRRVEGVCKRLIVLDLARVGTGTGCGTEELLRGIRAEFPDIELLAGGGVRTRADVDRLGDAGADGVLVASALHNGAIGEART